MKKSIISFSLIFIFLAGFNPSSESFKFSIGKPVRTGKRTSVIIGKFGDNIIVKSTKGMNVYFNKMLGTKFIKKAKINLRFQNEKLTYKGDFSKNNKLYILLSRYNSRYRKEYYYYREFDVDQMKEVGKMELIGDVHVKNRLWTGYIGVANSNDSTKTVLYMFNSDKGKNKQEIIFVVLDKDLKVLWKKRSFINYLDKEFEITSTTIDNEGVVYFAGKKYRKKARRKTTPYLYHILIFTKDVEEAEDIEVKLNKYYINDMVLTIADNGDIVFAGFYSPDKSWTIDGSFYLRLDGKTHEVVSDNYKEFSTSFITQGLSNRIKKKAKRKEKRGKNIQFYKYDLSDIIRRTDGGIILVAEQNYVVTYTYTSSNGVTTTYYSYYFDDIIIVNIDNTGTIVWNRKISKSQNASTSLGFSYIMGVYNNNMYFVINDNPKNRILKEPSNNKPYQGTKNADLIIYIVNPDGTIKKEFVKNTKPYKFVINPKSSYFNSSEGVFYLTSPYPNKKILMATIKIE